MSLKLSVLKELPKDLNPDTLPNHVAVIMDGNGRWAQRQGLPRTIGHQRGVNALRELVRCCGEWGIKAITAYAFSTENWGRPLEEVEFLMTLFEKVISQELKELMAKNVQIHYIGNLEQLPLSLQKQIANSQEATSQNQGTKLIIATNYGGRQEIIQACKMIAQQVQEGKLQPDEIDAKIFENNLYTAGITNPDLLIRTSGEMRISNFLLWQIAYAEIYVTDTLWPDFDRSQFHQALRAYQKRDRRFGKVDAKK